MPTPQEPINSACGMRTEAREALGVRPWAVDPALADRLWVLSERMTGVTSPTP